MSHLTRRPRLLLAALAVAVAMLAAQSVVLAAVTVKSGKAVTAVKVATETATANISTTSSAGSWTDVPGMSVSIKVPSSQQALLLITYSAESVCQDNDGVPSTWCLVRVLVDGTPASPGEVVFDAASDGVAWESNSTQFVAGPVGSGSHTVKVQARLHEDASTFGIDARTLTVLRSKV